MDQCELCDQSGVPLVNVGGHVLCFACEERTDPGALTSRLSFKAITQQLSISRQLADRRHEEEEQKGIAQAAAIRQACAEQTHAQIAAAPSFQAQHVTPSTTSAASCASTATVELCGDSLTIRWPVSGKVLIERF